VSFSFFPDEKGKRHVWPLFYMKKNMNGEEVAPLIGRFLEGRSLQKDRVIENYRQQCDELDPLVNCPGAPDPDAIARLKGIVESLRNR
jgi:hypothetical protein